MSDAADLSRVTALAHKGFALALKGHNARAAEKFRLAAEEVEKALAGPDCLVLCALRVLQLDTLLSHATASAAEPADAHDALREACLRLLPSVMAVLERRKAAGTLLPGTCRPVEETYAMTVKRHSLELAGSTQAWAGKEGALLAPHVGLETYMRVAACAAFMLSNLHFCERAFVLSDEQKHTAYLFVASALDLMTLPRNYGGWLAGEPGLVRNLRELIPAISSLDKPATIKLCAAWQRLLRSGMLRARRIDEGIDERDQMRQRISAAAEADLAAGRLQTCASAGCAASESHASQFKRCGACRTVSYCCREHQVEDWPSHKAACKAARKDEALTEQQVT